MNEIKNKEELKNLLESLRASNYSHIPKNLLSLYWMSWLSIVIMLKH